MLVVAPVIGSQGSGRDLPSDLLRPPPCLGAMMESGVAEEGRGYMGWSAAVQFVLSGIVGNQVRL